MPKAARRTSGSKAASRTAPYTKSPPSKPDKENVNPDIISAAEKSTNYLDIELEEVKGEVPVYENATIIRRKLNKLITDKAPIPGTSKKFNKTSMAGQMAELKQNNHDVESTNHNGGGPSANSLDSFLKKKGTMGGGDSECYYWGNMLLEKLRIYNGEKKTKSRIEAEEDFPGGRVREDPKHVRVICMVGSRPVWEPLARGLQPPRFQRPDMSARDAAFNAKMGI